MFSIPNKAIPYILYQRTAYLKFNKTRLYKRFMKLNPPFDVYKHLVKLEGILCSQDVKKLYVDDMEQEYQSIKEFLPEKCASILDIGCGIAAINILLNHHYAGQNPEFYLLDKSALEDKIFYHFKDRGAFYNSLDLARDVLLTNGIREDKIHLREATDQNDIDVKNASLDLIISLISWGFHYPVETYLEQAYQKLSSGGMLIIDVRKDMGGYEQIEKKFGNIKVIKDFPKFLRVQAVKN